MRFSHWRKLVSHLETSCWALTICKPSKIYPGRVHHCHSIFSLLDRAIASDHIFNLFLFLIHCLSCLFFCLFAISSQFSRQTRHRVTRNLVEVLVDRELSLAGCAFHVFSVVFEYLGSQCSCLPSKHKPWVIKMIFLFYSCVLRSSIAHYWSSHSKILMWLALKRKLWNQQICLKPDWMDVSISI